MAPGRDRALPALERAQDAAAMAPRLRDLLGGEGALEVRLLKHVPGKRCVLAYEFATGSRAIGKLYRRNRCSRQAASLLELAAALRGETSTPRLLACWEDLGLVLQEWVPGVALGEYAALAGRPELAARLGGALADLHASPVRLGPLADVAAHLRRTCHPGLGALGDAFPHLGAVLLRVEREMYAREAALAQSLRPCHGDFSPHQIFMDGERVYLVDVDGLCHSDPAFDVANFRVGLQAHLGGAAAPLAARFLGAYLERRGLEALPGLPHYEALGHLRRAMILWRKRPSNWEEQVHLCVERSRERLGIA